MPVIFFLILRVYCYIIETFQKFPRLFFFFILPRIFLNKVYLRKQYFHNLS
jgi:hypothetical protein